MNKNARCVEKMKLIAVLYIKFVTLFQCDKTCNFVHPKTFEE